MHNTNTQARASAGHTGCSGIHRQRNDSSFASFYAIEATDTLCHYHGIFAFIFLFIQYLLRSGLLFLRLGDANAAYTIKRKSHTTHFGWLDCRRREREGEADGENARVKSIHNFSLAVILSNFEASYYCLFGIQQEAIGKRWEESRETTMKKMRNKE